MGCFLSCFQDNNIEYQQIEMDNTQENHSDHGDFYEDYYTNYFDTVYRRRFCTYD
jgi:hypothetical protein